MNTIHIDGWTLAVSKAPDGTDEHRMRDLELAARLEMPQPRDIRQLIERHVGSGDITPIANRVAVPRFTSTGVSRGSVNATEYWLDEADALFITAKSQTEKANALTKEVIRVFVLARRGLLPSQTPAIDVTAIVAAITGAIGTRLDAMARDITSLRESTTPQALGVIGPRDAKSMCKRICRCARDASNSGAGKFRALIADYHRELRETVNFHRPWPWLPIGLHGDVKSWVGVLERKTAVLVERAGIRQPPLPHTDPTKPN